MVTDPDVMKWRLTTEARCLCVTASSLQAAPGRDCSGSGVWGRGAVSVAVTGREDDGLGCRSRPLFLMGCDVPRRTLATSPACPLTCRHKQHNILFVGGTAALLASGACLGVIWLPFWCLRGPRWREPQRLCA